jgi:hypothetical protein
MQNPQAMIRALEPFTYTVRPDRGNLPEGEYRAALQAGHQREVQHSTFEVQQTPVPEAQQRAELGEALLAYEQRQQLEFSHLRGPAMEP